MRDILFAMRFWSSAVSIGCAFVFAVACGGDPVFDGSADGDGDGGDGDSTGGKGNGNDSIDTGDIGQGGQGEANDGKYVTLESIRIDPEDSVIYVSPGQSVQQAFRVFGQIEGGAEQDITERSVFYVPEGFMIARFPTDGSNTLSTLVPSDASDPPQQGGKFVVQAQAANADGEIVETLTEVTVILKGAILPAAGAPGNTPPLPSDPSSFFSGEADEAYAPVLVYPNDGALLPPNLGQLEVHFQPGSDENILYQISFSGGGSELEFYTRCVPEEDDFVAGACVLRLTNAEFSYVAASNQGRGPVAVVVRGSNEQESFGESAVFTIEFAEERVDGAVYYWSATGNGEIVRFDFGSGVGEPETFLNQGSIPGNGNCIGCHALSRQGDKMFLSMGNSSVGRLAYIADMTLNVSEPEGFFTYNGAGISENRVLTGSFNPDGSLFVAAAPRNDSEPETKLFFHSGETGERESSITLPFTVSHPEWSPLGNQIALTQITGTNNATITFARGGIALVNRESDGWDAANPIELVPAVTGKNRYTPSYVPDGSLLLFTEVDEASYSGGPASSCTNGGAFCDGYSDPGATTWAVVPEAGNTPVYLQNAGRVGVADGMFGKPQTNVDEGSLMDTFPKATPFQTTHRGRDIAWFTISSQRRIGLRRQYTNPSVVGDPATQATLWMFAIDMEKVKQGEDGSYASFFLPFQDLKTSNHMAQWTERIADAPDAPPPPSPPPPPPPPPRPAPIVR